MNCWNQMLVETSRGTFEVFTKGEGNPICVTHQSLSIPRGIRTIYKGI
ncbi:hypothetical protein [Neobacillus niacini]